MSRLAVAPAAEKEGQISGDWPHKGRQNGNIRATVDAVRRRRIRQPDPFAAFARKSAASPGIKELLATHSASSGGYDTDAYRAILGKEGKKPVVPGKSANRKRSASGMIKMNIKNGTSSNAASEGSRTSAVSLQDTTSSRKTSFRPSASSLP